MILDVQFADLFAFGVTHIAAFLFAGDRIVVLVEAEPLEFVAITQHSGVDSLALVKRVVVLEEVNAVVLVDK
jgi:hypothetical protein